MTTAIARLFTSHPHSVDESYFEHMAFAARFGFWLLIAALAALVHAVLPFLFERTASSIICRLHERIRARAGTATNG